MTVLSDPDRADICANIQRDPLVGTWGAVTKTDLRAAINAADDWANTNAAAFNAALPQPARGALTAGQKARLLQHVIDKRFTAGS